MVEIMTGPNPPVLSYISPKPSPQKTWLSITSIGVCGCSAAWFLYGPGIASEKPFLIATAIAGIGALLAVVEIFGGRGKIGGLQSIAFTLNVGAILVYFVFAPL
jgi:hypothetical protein